LINKTFASPGELPENGNRNRHHGDGPA